MANITVVRRTETLTLIQIDGGDCLNIVPTSEMVRLNLTENSRYPEEYMEVLHVAYIGDDDEEMYELYPQLKPENGHTA